MKPLHELDALCAEKVAGCVPCDNWKPFLHASLTPLGEVDFSTDTERGQGMLAGFGNECEGMCGV